MPDLSSAAGLPCEQIVLLPRASVSPAEVGTLVTKLAARRGRGGAWADISRRLKTRRERQPAASRYQAGLSLSCGKDDGSGGASWQRVQERGKRRGCSKSGSAEQGLAGCPRRRGHIRASPQKVPAAIPTSPWAAPLPEPHIFWGPRDPHLQLGGLAGWGGQGQLVPGCSPQPPTALPRYSSTSRCSCI